MQECGADCVKFQKTDLNEKFNAQKLLQPYDSVNSWGATYGEHKKYLEFSEEQFIALQSYAHEIGILFTASAMDLKSLQFLIDMQVPFVKIGSGDANNLPLIEKAAQSGLPLIISTGMQDGRTVDTIYETVSKYHKNFILLQCTSTYPTPYAEINLNVLKSYIERFADINIGFSGHEIGFHPTLAAVAVGAKVIERHLTLDKSLKGTDHKCSLDVAEFKALVTSIRQLELAFGSETKQIQPSEGACIEKLGKTVVLRAELAKGHRITRDDLSVKVALPRGIDPVRMNEVIGAVLVRDKGVDESLLWEDIKR